MKYPNGHFKEKPCKTCGSSFTPTAPSQLYCGAACRGKTAYYQRTYGLTEADYRRRLEEQGHKCYLCGSSGFLIGTNNHSEKLAVDHCHDTGKVRKILCHNCNRALGLLQDSPELMRRAAEYIEAHRDV